MNNKVIRSMYRREEGRIQEGNKIRKKISEKERRKEEEIMI